MKPLCSELRASVGSVAPVSRTNRSLSTSNSRILVGRFGELVHAANSKLENRHHQRIKNCPASVTSCRKGCR